MLEVGVVGGGLMGMATSYFLLRSGRCRVTLYDAALRRPITGYNACASAVAGGLLHPLAGVKPAWEATEALRKADALVREAEREAHMDLVTTDVVLRPAIDHDDAADLRNRRCGPARVRLEWLEPDAFILTSGRADLDRGGRTLYIGGGASTPGLPGRASGS